MYFENLWKAFETAKSKKLAELFGDKLIIEKEVVIKKDLRQVVTATSDGAIAAINVANYLKK